MTNLTLNKIHTHTPHKEAVSRVIHSFEDETQYTFCEECEQNIDRSCFYDDDRGIVWTKWKVSK
jgi:hypothetical protein